MVTIHIDFVDKTEISYIEGIELLQEDHDANFTTNCLSFFNTKSHTSNWCKNVIIIDKHGRCIDRNELMSNEGHRYTDKHMREAHNIYKMLMANSYIWKQPGVCKDCKGSKRSHLDDGEHCPTCKVKEYL